MKDQAPILFLRPVLAAALLLTAGAVAVPSERAVAQDLKELDHLKCYHVIDSLHPSKFTVDLRNQFGLEEGCLVRTPAKFLCAETAKRVVGPPFPPGGGPSGAAAGHFLCYEVRCPHATIPNTEVQDQFGTRFITFQETRFLCAPADKFICGDGDLDPGEECDGGGGGGGGGDRGGGCDGLPCNDDCTCPEPCKVDSAGQCGGECPSPDLVCSQTDSNGGCTCLPVPKPCGPDAASQCSGDCPNPGEVCVQAAVGGDCRCLRPCGRDDDGECSGECRNPNEVCTLVDAELCQCRLP